jgi:ATP synthase protein I
MGTDKHPNVLFRRFCTISDGATVRSRFGVKPNGFLFCPPPAFSMEAAHRENIGSGRTAYSRTVRFKNPKCLDITRFPHAVFTQFLILRELTNGKPQGYNNTWNMVWKGLLFAYFHSDSVSKGCGTMADNSRKPNLPEDLNPWRTFGLVTALGLEMAVCIGLGWWLGTVYDDRNGTGYGYLTGVIIGLIAGIGSAVALIRKYSEDRRP